MTQLRGKQWAFDKGTDQWRNVDDPDEILEPDSCEALQLLDIPVDVIYMEFDGLPEDAKVVLQKFEPEDTVGCIKALQKAGYEVVTDMDQEIHVIWKKA